MSVVDDVPFPRTQVLPNDGAQALNPADADAADLVDEQTLAGEDGLADGLGLVVLRHALRACQKRLLAHGPQVGADEADVGHVAQHVWGDDELARARVDAVCHFPARDQLLHAKLEVALERDGGRHGDHDARLGRQRTAHGQLDRHDGVGVAVADAVRATVEGAHVVDCRAGPDKVSGRRRTAGHVESLAGVENPWGHGRVGILPLFGREGHCGRARVVRQALLLLGRL